MSLRPRTAGQSVVWVLIVMTMMFIIGYSFRPDTKYFPRELVGCLCAICGIFPGMILVAAIYDRGQNQGHDHHQVHSRTLFETSNHPFSPHHTVFLKESKRAGLSDAEITEFAKSFSAGKNDAWQDYVYREARIWKQEHS